MTTLLIATRNAHKVQEVCQILGGNFRCLTLNDCPGAPVAVEDAETFAGNATGKVLSLAEWLTRNPEAVFRTAVAEAPFYILADDSGLEVDALEGAPGVHSARFAAQDLSGAANSPDSANNAKLLRLLKGKPAHERAARFRCVLAVLWLSFCNEPVRALPYSPSEIILFEGVCEGVISETAAGRDGFGYDPLFIPNGQVKSFAELGEEIKNNMSHRARALEKLKQFMGNGHD
jgi:XTP/dITP diphosphohydrolase